MVPLWPRKQPDSSHMIRGGEQGLGLGIATPGQHLVWSPFSQPTPCLPVGGRAHMSPGPPPEWRPLEGRDPGGSGPTDPSAPGGKAGPPKDTAMAMRQAD